MKIKRREKNEKLGRRKSDQKKEQERKNKRGIIVTKYTLFSAKHETCFSFEYKHENQMIQIFLLRLE